MATVENIIIGAGPYGLSIAAHLRAAHVSHAIVGKPMESWRRQMPAGMALKSEVFASNLSDPERRYTLELFYASRGLAYAHKGVPLSIVDFLDYADWFQRHAAPEIWDAKLRDLRWLSNGFELTLDDRHVLAKRVIVATGHLAFRHIPQALRHFADDAHAPVSHSADHQDLARFCGDDVTVIGCGQSGLETAALLHEQGANVRVIARAPAVDWNPDVDQSGSVLARLRQPESGLGPGWRSLFYSEAPRGFFMLPAAKRRHIVATSHAPAGAWWLRNRVVGKVPLLTSHHVIAAAERAGGLELSVRSEGDTTQIATDHVIAATGYRVDLNRLAFLDPEVRAAIKTADGAPVLNSAFESSVPGLHFVGIASALSFGPVMRFVYGARHAAAILTSHIRSSPRQRSRSPSTVFGAKNAAR
jgi:cation diffusion facilitator CzcD-associated flavoprotein CzcO